MYLEGDITCFGFLAFPVKTIMISYCYFWFPNWSTHNPNIPHQFVRWSQVFIPPSWVPKIYVWGIYKNPITAAVFHFFKSVFCYLHLSYQRTFPSVSTGMCCVYEQMQQVTRELRSGSWSEYMPYEHLTAIASRGQRCFMDAQEEVVWIICILSGTTDHDNAHWLVSPKSRIPCTLISSLFTGLLASCD